MISFFFFRSLVGNKLVTKKLTTKTNSLPRWAERVRDIFLAFYHSAREQYMHVQMIRCPTTEHSFALTKD